MGVRVLTPPTRLPVETTDVLRHLGLAAHFGEHVIALMEAATERAEAYVGRALITRTLVATFDGFDGCRKIELPEPPLIEVAAVRYLDDDGVQQTLDEDLYRVVTTEEPGWIEPAYGQWWPSVRGVSQAVEVEYSAGYGEEVANVPATIRHAITMMIGEWIEFREGQVVGTISKEIPSGVMRLLDQNRLGRLFVGTGM